MRYCDRGKKLSTRIRRGRAGIFAVTGCTVAMRTDLPPLYLAVHHAVVVMRCSCRIVGAICSLVNEEDGCTASCRVQVPSPGILLEKGKIVYVKDMYSVVFVHVYCCFSQPAKTAPGFLAPPSRMISAAFSMSFCGLNRWHAIL